MKLRVYDYQTYIDDVCYSIDALVDVDFSRDSFSHEFGVEPIYGVRSIELDTYEVKYFDVDREKWVTCDMKQPLKVMPGLLEHIEKEI